MPATKVTLLAPVSSQQATDYGISGGSNVAGAVVSIDQQNAENLVHQGLAAWGSDAERAKESGRSYAGAERTVQVAAGTAVTAANGLVGAAIDLGADHQFDTVRLAVNQAGAGTASVEQSPDGSHWFSLATPAALTGGTTAEIDAKIVGQYVRAHLTASADTTATAELAFVRTAG